MKRSSRDILVIGLALFSMFFGAGNIIFPPYLGLESGTQWLTGFASYYLADIGLSVAAIFVVLRYNGQLPRIIGHLGRIPGELMLSAIILCIGPLIAVPRTGATTYEMFVVPLFGEVPPLLPNVLFFALTLLLCIRESSVVDILGKFLTPALFLGLMFLIFKGITDPVGSITDTFMNGSPLANGILTGYQTMDSLAAMIFGIIIFNAVRNKGYTKEKDQFKIALAASLVAAFGLFLVYGGLTYLGATSSGSMNGRILRTDLILYITNELLGRFGVVVLGIVVALACITTSVALITSASDYFSNLSKGRIKYQWLAIALCLFSSVVATTGTDQIVAIASPILSLLYPGMLTLLFFSFFFRDSKNDFIIRGAVIAALIVSILEVLNSYGYSFELIKFLPLASWGLAWVTPAILGAIIGYLLKKADECITPPYMT